MKIRDIKSVQHEYVSCTFILACRYDLQKVIPPTFFIRFNQSCMRILAAMLEYTLLFSLVNG